MVGATLLDPSRNSVRVEPMQPYAFVPTPPDIAAPAYRRKARPAPLLLEETPLTFAKSHSNLSPHLGLATPLYQVCLKSTTPTMQAAGRQTGQVWFNSPVNSLHVVTPYSQVYGIHPKYFHFDANGSLQPTPKAQAGLLGARGLEMAAKISSGQIMASRSPMIFAEERAECPPTARGDAAVVWNNEASALCNSPVSLQAASVNADKKSKRPARPKPSESKFHSSPAVISFHPKVVEATLGVPRVCSTASGLYRNDVEKSAV